MKRHGIHSGSCSCTSCVYRSRSKQPSVQQLLEEGTRIDKLYYGKYLPLRERKLLEKLIRTRAVYDDVRNQLLSSSGSSVHTRSEHKIKRRVDDSTEKSSAVLKIVDLVDRGQIGSSNTSKLSSCCSCCSCSSFRKIQKHMEKHPRVHKHHVPYEEIAKYTVEAEKRGRRRRKRLSTKISSKMRAVRFKVKQIRSEPCTCTLSLTSMIKRSSKSFINKVHSKEKATANTEVQKLVEIEKNTLKKRICSCSCKIAKIPMKSYQKIKNIRKSNTPSSRTEMENQKVFRIKKDSLTLFREKLKKQRYLEGECPPGTCNEDECIPDQCLKKIKTKGFGKSTRKKYHSKTSGTQRERNKISISTRPKKTKQTDSKVQVAPKPSLGPTTKSASSMTLVPKSKSFANIKSTTTDIKRKRKLPQQKPQLTLKETVIQEKAHRTDRYRPKRIESSTEFHEKEKVKSTPKSKLNLNSPKIKSKYSMTTILKTKGMKSVSKTEIKFKHLPRTRLMKQETPISTSSMTKSKDSKSRSTVGTKVKRPLKHTNKRRKYKSRREHYKYHEQEVKQENEEPEKQAVKISSSFKFEIEFSKKRHPTLTNNEIIEHVKMKRAKRIKPSNGQRKQNIQYKHSKTQVAGLLPKEHRDTKSNPESQEFYLRELASQTSKQTQDVILPFPRECEPFMCIPYECDPENCAQILLSRSPNECNPKNCPRKLLYRGESSSTDRIRRKSAGSTTSSFKKNSKSKYIQSKSTEGFITKKRNASKQSTYQTVEKDINAESSHPQKQAVRIGSSFSFNIEFYKEKPPAEKTDFSYEPQKFSKKKDYKTQRERGQRSKRINYRNISSQSRSSESIKNIQVGHRLKRCFCTLKLMQKKKQKVKKDVSKKTMASFNILDFEKGARIKKTQTKSAGFEYVRVPAYSTSPLLPYECEPFSCTPGECNPYECKERIKARNRKEAYRIAKETNTVSTSKKSAWTFTSEVSSKSLSRRIQTTEQKHRKQKTKHSNTSRHESYVSTEKPVRQAVRIGSSFSFKVEFSKEKNDQAPPDETAKIVQPHKPIQKEKKRMQQKGIKVHKPCVCNASSATGKNVKEKLTNTTPFLQRCFCTLKLMNKNKRKLGTVTPLRNQNDFFSHMQNKSITAHRADIRYNHEVKSNRSKFKNVSYGCDQYDCADLMNLSLMKFQHRYSNTGEIITSSVFSGTSRTVTSSTKSRNTIRGENKNETDIKTKWGTPSLYRQAVRIGSDFNFNVEYYKDKPFKKINTQYQVYNKPDKKIDERKINLRRRGSEWLQQRAAEDKGKTRGISVGSAIKKCFCTLKLYKKGKIAKQQGTNIVIRRRTVVPYETISPQICETRENKCTPNYSFKSYEGAPEFCFPTMCYPYEYYNDTNNRETSPLRNRHISTEKLKRKSIISMISTEFGDSWKTKNPESKLSIPVPEHNHKLRHVRQDMRQIGSFSPSYQAAHLSSKYSNNKKIIKHRTVQVHDAYKMSTGKCNTKSVSDTTTANKNKIKDIQDKRAALQYPLQESNIMKKEKKSSNKGFILKRCLCRLGLHKKNIVSKLKHNHDVGGNQSPTKIQAMQMVQSKSCNHEWPNMKKRQEQRIAEFCHIKEPSHSFQNKTLFERESFKMKVQKGLCPKGNRNTFISQRSAQRSSEYSSDIAVATCSGQVPAANYSHFDKNELGSVINHNMHKINPFYHSFYALNLKVSTLKNAHILDDNECEPGVCIPYECDPVECLKRINSRLKRSKTSETNRTETKSVTSMTKSKLESRSKTAQARFKNNKQRFSKNNRKSQQSRNSSPRLLRVGSDVNFSMEFYKDTNPYRNDAEITSKNSKYSKDAAMRNIKKHSRRNRSQINVQRENKATWATPLLKRCFCTFKFLNADQNKTNNRIEAKQATNTKSRQTSKSGSKQATKTETKRVNKTQTKQTAKPKQVTKTATIPETKTKHIDKTKKADNKNKNIINKSEKSEGTMANRPYGSVNFNENINTHKLGPYECAPNVCVPGECDPHKCYKLIQQRLKQLREHAVGTDYRKQKSTSSITKSEKYTKSVQSKPKVYKRKNNLSYSTGQQGRVKPKLRHSEKQAVTFGSNMSFKMEFFRDKTNASLGFSSARHSSVSPIHYMKGSGDNAKKTRDRGQNVINKPKMENAGNNVANMLSRCFCTLTLGKEGSKGKRKQIKNKRTTVKSESTCTQCEPQVCFPNKCVPVDCHNRIKKRLLRSKSTRVNGKKGPTSVKSAVIDRGTSTKEKRISKSFACEPYVCIPKECDPYDCIEKLKARGIIDINVGKTKKKKVKDMSLSTQRVEHKSKAINTDKEKQSLLEQCICVLTSKSVNPSTRTLQEIRCGFCEPKIKEDIKTQTIGSKLMKKCFCTLKLLKGGKELTPKPSRERIVDKKNIKKLNKPQKSIRNKKANNCKEEKEMETIMPYSKKKFKKLESQIKVTKRTSNIVDLYPCTCNLCPHCKTVEGVKFKMNKSNTKKKDKRSKENDDKLPMAQTDDQSSLCSNCKSREGVKTNFKPKPKVKASRELKTKIPVSRNDDQSENCPICNGVNFTMNKKNKNNGRKGNESKTPVSQVEDLCPHCKSQEAAKSNLGTIKETKKSKNNRTKMSVLQNDDRSEICPVCKSGMSEKLSNEKNKQKDHISVTNNKMLQNYNESDICSRCKAKYESHMSTFGNFMMNIKLKMSSLLSFRKQHEEVEEEEKPMFEMFVNKTNMNILNKDEVFAYLRSSSKESEDITKVHKGGEIHKSRTPIMKMLINKDNASIMNSEEILHTIIPNQKRKVSKIHSEKAASIHKKPPVAYSKSERAASSQPHGKKCQCCECLMKRRRLVLTKTGAKSTKPKKSGAKAGADGSTGAGGSAGAGDNKQSAAKVAVKPRKFKPCICGSVICQEKLEKMKSEQKRIKSIKVKPCVCGSDICQTESRKMPKVLLKAARKAQQEKYKQRKRIEAEKRYQKERLLRKKIYAQEDAERWERRRKRDRHDMKKLKKYEENTTDPLKAAESLVDVGKFGGKAIFDILRTICRAVRHPRDAVHNIKDAINDPSQAMKEAQDSCEGMGFFATMKRVKRRFFGMAVTKTAIYSLESIPVTNYLIHIADKDPKKRMKKFKKKRVREPMDFECSLFMGSLRKRPCLVVYYMCPWFYPHCVSLIGAWRQCTDILLFILAVGVWSPCILLMEICRAMMCCFLCTG